jgi:hypothetical protein
VEKRKFLTLPGEDLRWANTIERILERWFDSEDWIHLTEQGGVVVAL